MGLIKKIAVTALFALVGASIVALVNEMANQYAIVSFTIEGPSAIYLSDPIAEVELRMKNDGSISAVPIAAVSVSNATIMSIAIPGVPQYELYNYCTYNETYATISNLTISRATPLSKWATVSIRPENGATIFTINTNVDLQADWLHPRNDGATRILPTALMYNHTDANLYSLVT